MIRGPRQARQGLRGGGRDGSFFEPTVLTDISPDNDAYREELFGPVAQVYRVSSEEEAVKLARMWTGSGVTLGPPRRRS